MHNQEDLPKNSGMPKFESREASQLAFNRNRLRAEFKDDKIGEVKLELPLNELLSRIEEIERGGKIGIIEDAVEIQGEKYDMVVNYSNEDFMLAVGKEGKVFNTNRGNDSRVAGWAGQGDFSFISDFAEIDYTHSEHWGVSVDFQFKKVGLADFLYNLAALTQKQLKFEHVDGKNYPFLTFYIKKGYVPYAVVTPPTMTEQVLSQEEVTVVINNLKENRQNLKEGKPSTLLELNGAEEYALKLKFNPTQAIVIYNQIRS